MRRVALICLAAVALSAIFAPQLAPWRYDEQFRDAPNAAPGGRFLMGTDEIGRDRLSRLLYGTRVSVLLAPAAAMVSIALALLISITAASRLPAIAGAVSGFTTICLALPWLFLFIILRAKLPLNTEPITSVILTFALMGVSGWAYPARVFTACIQRSGSPDGCFRHRRPG